MIPALRAATDSGTNESPADSEITACNELGTILSSELADVEEEINRIADIIAEAVVQLSSSFDQIYHLSGAQQTTSENAGSDDLEAAVSGAVRALQFEDIAAQALDEARRSVASLRQAAQEVETVEDTQQLTACIARQRLIWEEIKRKAVLQKNLDQGSVDLFEQIPEASGIFQA